MSVETNTQPSRQALVVPPRGSNLPVVLGAVVSAGVGFAAVWAVGLGRSTLPRSPHPEIQPAVQPGEEVVANVPPGPPVAESERPDGSRWGDGAADAAAVRPWPPVPRRRSTADRGEVNADEVGADEVHPASFAAPGRFTPPDAAPRPLRSFSGPRSDDLEPAAGAESGAVPETEALPPIGGGAGGSHARVDLSSADQQRQRPPASTADAADAAAGRVDSGAPPDAGAADDIDATGQEPAAGTAEKRPATDPFAPHAPPTPADAPLPAVPAASRFPPPPAGPAAAATAVAPPVTVPDGAASPAPPVPAPAGPPPSTAGLLPPPAFAPPRPPPAAAANVPAAPAVPVPATPAATPAVPVPAAFAAPAAAPAVSPFASAPPLVPGTGGPPAIPVASPFASPPPPALATASPSAAPPADADPLDPASGPAAAAVGQGRPGPPQLDGLQSPQFALEKRGPREIQVGKAARYEILLRNVGSATASDVVLRDAIPYGAALVTTTPPASPGETPDALVWRLGVMPPGGQARVVVELMPQTEGEIGSVASVTFRADASIRSRATKPALAIECRDPAAVRIGQDASVTITVSNPGTGVATGVVVEGTLPDTVSHRSGRELEFDVGQLRPGEARSIDLVLGTTGPGVRSARIMARADGGIEAERAVRLEVTAPTLELGIDMPARRYLQRPATCQISMVNAGTATARAVELAAQLAPGMRFVKANNAGWHDTRTNRVLWNLEELPPGETGTVQVVVMPVELGPQKLLAAARSADGPADQVTHVCEVEGVAALAFEVTDSEDPIEVDGVTEYVVRVGNNGTQAATAVQLAATLLGDLELVDAKGPAGHRVENLAVFFEPLAKLAPAEEAVYRVRVKGRQAGSQRVQVQLTSADHPAPITKEETTRVYDDR